MRARQLAGRQSERETIMTEYQGRHRKQRRIDSGPLRAASAVAVGDLFIAMVLAMNGEPIAAAALIAGTAILLAAFLISTSS